MPSSIVEICNSALSKIGGAAIQALSEDSREAVACNLRYNHCKRIVLRGHPWNCAIDRVSLAPTTTAPAFDFTYQFVLPANCLRVLHVYPDEASYKIEGRNILSDDSSIQLRFIYDVSESLMDDLLSEAIACYLGWDIAYKITQKMEVRNDMWKQYMLARREAKSVDAQEERDFELEANDFIESRENGESPGRSNR